MNRQGSLEVNWPQAKRDRPGPFALDQTTFQNEFILKSACAYRNKFDRHSRRNCKVPAAVRLGKRGKRGEYVLLAQAADQLLGAEGGHVVGVGARAEAGVIAQLLGQGVGDAGAAAADRKSTRLNSSHLKLSRMPSSA